MSRDIRTGKNANASANGTPICGVSWDADWTADDADGSCFESQGYDEGTIGIMGVSWSLGWLWRVSMNVVTGPPGMYPRDDLQLTLGLPTGGWAFPAARVLSSKMTIAIRSVISGNASGKSNGSFTVA